ncbi:MAG: hypothetical protein NTV97_05110 [Alphaproteobacteria bacterium]|nr:hypothetical protein [Alphaproteobacteria bacterium]
MIRFCVVAISFALLLSGCGGTKISTLPATPAETLSSPVRVIALAPNGGLLADAVGVELANRGYTVVDAADTSSMMVRFNMNEVEVQRPENLRKFRGQGIDAFLNVRASGAAYDGQPQGASARVVSTETGKLLAGVTWQNAWGGQMGSIADRTMRKGLNEAATEIANALAASLARIGSGSKG